MFSPLYRSGAAVTPSDSTVYEPKGSGLWVGGAGNVAVRVNGTTFVLIGVPAGTLLPLDGIEQVRTTSTTATNMVILYR